MYVALFGLFIDVIAFDVIESVPNWQVGFTQEKYGDLYKNEKIA